MCCVCDCVRRPALTFCSLPRPPSLFPPALPACGSSLLMSLATALSWDGLALPTAGTCATDNLGAGLASWPSCTSAARAASGLSMHPWGRPYVRGGRTHLPVTLALLPLYQAGLGNTQLGVHLRWWPLALHVTSTRIDIDHERHPESKLPDPAA